MPHSPGNREVLPATEAAEFVPRRDWRVGARVWVECAGRAILGKGRLELLAGIDRHRSISAAAREMKMSYRHAWLMVQSINNAAGEPLVNTATGGRRGGGAQLTPLGRWAVEVFQEVQARLQQTVAAILPRIFHKPPGGRVHVAAAVSLVDVLGQLLADYGLKRPTVRVRVIFGASDELADQLLAGAPADLFLTADARQLRRLQAAGMLAAPPPILLASNTLAVIGPAAGRTKLRKPADLVQPRIRSIALAEPSCPLGGYTRAYLESQRLEEAVHSRALFLENSWAVVAAVRGRQVDVGLVYGSDAARASDCRLLMRIHRLPAPIRYLAAPLAESQQGDETQALLGFLTSPEAGAWFRQCGFIVASRGAPVS
jgi:molybdenum ABC transporter molybdate-binding protein